MTKIAISSSIGINATVRASLRYSFTAQFLHGAAIFAKAAHEIEKLTEVDDDQLTKHRAYVVSTIIQCSAAFESEIAEIFLHGPGHHLGSGGNDVKSKSFLEPLAKPLDRLPTLQKYYLCLHLLQKEPLNEQSNVVNDIKVLVSLRNELVHYKSLWDVETSRKKLISRFKQLRLAPPPFIAESLQFFPHKFLSASLASWSVNATKAFIDKFFEHLGFKSPLEPYTERLIVPDPQKVP